MRNHQKTRMRKAIGNDIASTGLNLAIQGGYILGFLWCGYGLLHGTSTYGILAVIQLIGQIQTPFVSLGGIFPQHAALRFHDVDFTYGRNVVLHHFSCTIRKGDFTAITGRSGIGKSTLLKLLLGAYSPSSGKIIMDAMNTDGGTGNITLNSTISLMVSTLMCHREMA